MGSAGPAAPDALDRLDMSVDAGRPSIMVAGGTSATKPALTPMEQGSYIQALTDGAGDPD